MGHNGGFNPYRDAAGRFASGPGGRSLAGKKNFTGHGLGGDLHERAKPGRGYRSAKGSPASSPELKAVEAKLKETWRPVAERVRLEQEALALRGMARRRR